MDSQKVLAARLKKLREKTGLNQAAFSESIQLKQPTYNAYEKGANKPQVDTLIKIAQKYNVSIDWLCGLSDDEGRPKLFFDTYADILSVIFEMGFLDGFCADANFAKIEDGTFQYEYDNNYRYFIMFYFDDLTINKILEDWKKMHDLLNGGLIDEEVYSLWVEKTLKKYDSFYSASHNVIAKDTPIDTEDIPDELPFS